MNQKYIPLGRILGIPIGLDYSWFLIFFLLSWMLADSYFPVEFKNWSVPEYWAAGIITSLMLFVSVIFHELGHSIVAIKYKIKVKRIHLFIFGGIAEIAGEPPKASAEFWIAIAGPIVSFLLSGVFYALMVITANLPFVFAIFKYLAFINFVLSVFNLIPGFPLDGGRVFRAIVWGFTHNLHKATYIAATVGRFFGFFFIFLGVLQIFRGDLGNGLWIAFIGWFLESAAASQLQQQFLEDYLTGHTVSEAMTNDYAIVQDDTTIQEVMDNHFLGIGRRSLFVKKEDQFVGMLTLHNIKEVPANKWAETKISDVMISHLETQKVDLNTPLWDALTKMDKDGVNQLPVMENNQVLGVLSRESLITFLKTIGFFGNKVQA